MFKSGKSEYEPLISSSNPFYDEINTENRSKSTICRYSAKILLVFLAVLLLGGVMIYQFLPRQPLAAPLNMPSGRNYNWLQAEASHTHSAHVPKSWAEKSECPEDHKFTLTLALKQQNAEALHEHVTAVSHPSSQHKDTFHKYWSTEKVRSYFKPSDDAVNSVLGWLEENGFSEDNGKMDMVTSYGNVIRVSLNCGQANKLLNTQYMLFENSKTGKQHLRVKDGIYNMPDTVHQHIDFMSPTIRFPLERHTLTVQTMTEKSVNFIKSHSKDELREYYRQQSGDKGDKGTDPRQPTDDDEEETPNIPERLYAMYRMSDSMTEIIGDDFTAFDNSVCRQAVASFIEQYYSDADLELFHTDLEVDPESTMERVPASQPQGYGSEAELDTQYMTSTGKGIYTYVYYIDSDDIFVSLAEAILATDSPPLVVSISYGADEYELGQDWVTRCNQEFGKLALIGTTVLASSGDSGVRGNDDDCFEGDISSFYEAQQEFDGVDVGKGKGKGKGKKKRTDDLHALSEKRRRLIPEGAALGANARGSSRSGTFGGSNSGSSTDILNYIASFPASAPYVTAVGGTEGGTIQSDNSMSTGETAWLYSGGGFSLYFDTPDWQKTAMSGYFEQDIEFPDTSRYNGAGRGYPDLAAQSVDYVIAYDSAFYLVSGTSASSPTVAGMISMINYARINAGKKALGFLNPSLYSLYEDQNNYFNDVTEGYNIGCEDDDNIGFYTATGWDPVTGLGTPKFDMLYKALLELD